MKKTKKPDDSFLIPDGWQYIPFGDVFEFIQSLSLSREQLTLDEGPMNIYNIHYGDIHATYKCEMLDFEIEKRIPKIKLGIPGPKEISFLKDGDLVIADASEDYEGVAACIEVINLKDKKSTGGLHTFVARDFKNLTVTGFRAYIFRHPIVRTELKKLATGSKVYGVSKANILKLKVLIPSKEDQKIIVQILAAFNKAIEKQTELIAAKEERKEALMQKLLSGNLRFKGFKAKWESKSLGDVCLKIQDGNYGGDYPTEGEFVEEGIAFLTSKALGGDGEVKKEKLNFITSSKHSQLKKGQIFKGDILFTNRGSNTGVIGYVDSWLDNSNIGPQLTFFRVNNDIISSKFLYHQLKSAAFQNQIKSKDSGSAMTFFGIGETSKFIVTVPPRDEQDNIEVTLSAVELEINNLRKQLDDIRKQKVGVMEQLLTGKTRLKK
jgi:type I restriction enzyme S subunit